jgi:hypothetical protein
MFGSDQRGVAVLTVVIIVAASTGVAVATPVVVSAAGADPDSPLYGLARLGEQIRMMSNEDQMKNRWVEYTHMVSKGKSLEYKYILEEFAGKMNDVVSENAGPKQEMVMWMQGQMPGIELLKLKLMKELCENLKENLPGVSGELENVLLNLENLENKLSTATSDSLENIRAELELGIEHLRQIAENYENQLREYIENYFAIDNILVDVDVRVNVEVDINIVRPIHVTTGNFENELENFNGSLSEVQAMLAGTPENALGRNAAERLVGLAIELENRAAAANEAGKTREALALIRAAQVHLRDAETILNHASEWEPELRENWANWKEAWENMGTQWVGTLENLRAHWTETLENIKQQTENVNWQSFMENYNQYRENIVHQWQEKWQERWQEKWH